MGQRAFHDNEVSQFKKNVSEHFPIEDFDFSLN